MIGAQLIGCSPERPDYNITSTSQLKFIEYIDDVSWLPETLTRTVIVEGPDKVTYRLTDIRSDSYLMPDKQDGFVGDNEYKDKDGYFDYVYRLNPWPNEGKWRRYYSEDLTKRSREAFQTAFEKGLERGLKKNNKE
jgi:hypothetical protein